MSDLRSTTAVAMDARTIARILRDEETLMLELEASKYRRLFEAQTQLKAYFQLATDALENGALPLIYKPYSYEEVALSTTVCPQTPDDFYALALAIKAGHHCFRGENFAVYQAGKPATPAVLKNFLYNVLNDAAKAGHLLAKSELIEATIQGEPAARKHVMLNEYHVCGVSIKLPRKFSTAEEYHKLGSDLLIQYRRNAWVDGRQLVGSYYELANGKQAGVLAQKLLKLAEEKRKQAAEERVRRAYAEQTARVSDKNTALFATCGAAENQQNIRSIPVEPKAHAAP